MQSHSPRFDQLRSRFLPFAIATLLLLVLVLALGTAESARAAGVCEDAFSGATPSWKVASEYLDGIVTSREPMTFAQAIEYVLLALPDGSSKNEFIESLQKVATPAVQVRDRFGWRTFFRSNRVAHRSKLRNFLTFHGFKDERRIYWNAYPVQSRTEALKRVMEAIRVVFEPEFDTIKFSTVYVSRRDGYGREFADAATRLFSIQSDIATVAVASPIAVNALPMGTPKWVKLRILWQTLKNVFWIREHRTVRELKLSQEIWRAYRTKGRDAAQFLILERYGPEILVNWYMKHLRNLQHAATLALAVVLVPPVAEAGFQHYALHSLTTENIEARSLEIAEEIYEQATDQALSELNKVLRRPLPPAASGDERRFLEAVEERIRADHKLDVPDRP